jgi:hypothetical protein
MPKPGLFYKLEAVVATAEEMAARCEDRWARRQIWNELVPSLYEARTYIEVGQLSSPEVRLALSKAATVASGLADADPAFAPLFSRVRVLQEDASARVRREQGL